GEVAASNQARKKTPTTWKQQEARRKQNFDRRGDFIYHQRSKRRRDKFTLLIKSPKEILDLDKVFGEVQAQIRSIFLDGYSILDVRTMLIIRIFSKFLDDLLDMPNDKEIRIPNPKRHGTHPPPHLGSPSAPTFESDGGHFQGTDESASEGDDVRIHS
ncbi:hypothetical protein Tco_0711024, partial [Tanacetum coccineum]